MSYLNKFFLKKLVEKDIDFLVIDNYFEIRMGILYFNDSIITNNGLDLPFTEFYKEINYKLILKITEYPVNIFHMVKNIAIYFLNF